LAAAGSGYNPSDVKPLTKIAIVVAGYAAALFVAWATVALDDALTDSPDRVASGGMFAFGMSLLFLGVFAVASIPASIAMLVFLRPHGWFWIAASTVALVIAGIGAVGLTTFWQVPGAARTELERWLILAGASVLIAPVFALLFGLAGLFAPNRHSRFALLGATAIEVALFGVMLVRWTLWHAG
jgi:hypothetical protein